MVLGCCHTVKSQDCREWYGMAPCGACVHSLDPSGNSVKSSCHEQQDMQFHQLSSEAEVVPSEHGGAHTASNPGSWKCVAENKFRIVNVFLKQKDKEHPGSSAKCLSYMCGRGFEGV